MIRSAKEAKGILSKNCPSCDDGKNLDCDCFSPLRQRAESYLTALQGPEVKALVEALAYDEGDGELTPFQFRQKAIDTYLKATK